MIIFTSAQSNFSSQNRFAFRSRVLDMVNDEFLLDGVRVAECSHAMRSRRVVFTRNVVAPSVKSRVRAGCA